MNAGRNGESKPGRVCGLARFIDHGSPRSSDNAKPIVTDGTHVVQAAGETAWSDDLSPSSRLGPLPLRRQIPDHGPGNVPLVEQSTLSTIGGARN